MWTPSRIRAFITSGLRAASSKWPPKYETLREAYTETKTNVLSGRQAKHYKCKKCGGEFTGANVEVDHIIPVIDPHVGFTTWDDFITRLFCPKENFQVLCKPCHKIKTKEETEHATKRKIQSKRTK